ncbi:MAG: hypothetical protein OMM_13112, partial [Candidatus Magnetoglobus multicellularis str. Araruama]
MLLQILKKNINSVLNNKDFVLEFANKFNQISNNALDNIGENVLNDIDFQKSLVLKNPNTYVALSNSKNAIIAQEVTDTYNNMIDALLELGIIGDQEDSPFLNRITDTLRNNILDELINKNYINADLKVTSTGKNAEEGLTDLDWQKIGVTNQEIVTKFTEKIYNFLTTYDSLRFLISYDLINNTFSHEPIIEELQNNGYISELGDPTIKYKDAQTSGILDLDWQKIGLVKDMYQKDLINEFDDYQKTYATLDNHQEIIRNRYAVIEKNMQNI